MRQREFLKRLHAASANARQHITGLRGDGGRFAAGLASEGYVGGYAAALDDVDAMLRHGYPSDQYGFWKTNR